MWLAHIRDTITYLQKHQSIADFPLFIHFQNSITNPDRYYDYYRKGYRQTSKNLVSPCAYVRLFEDGIDIVLRYPRLVCHYFPNRKCPHKDDRATVLLLNHEFMHALFESWESAEGDEAHKKWDDITRLMNEILPDTYCEC